MSRVPTDDANINRLDDREMLLAGHVLGDLDADERLLVDQLFSEPSSQETIRELERVAASVSQVAAFQSVEELPTSLRASILAEANEQISSGTFGREDHQVVERPSQVEDASGTSRAIERRERTAWILAAAASLLALATLAYAVRNPQKTMLVDVPLNLNVVREDFLASHPDATLIEWVEGPTAFDQAVTGDVVWDGQSQTGFMKFVGLPVNDPTIEQYQLWIIDPDRDEEPIDGGVFDSTSEGELVVRIDAKLKVINPQAFAITIEQPGGVVVSTQERLPLLAKVAI